jgi:hypothetical protein
MFCGLFDFFRKPIIHQKSKVWGVEIPPKLTTSFRGKLTTESYFAN